MVDSMMPATMIPTTSKSTGGSRLMSRSMETMVAAHPDQYLWMHDRWKSYD